MNTPQQTPPPPFRRLRVYAFDPGVGSQLEYVGINHLTLKVLWEHDRETMESTLDLGPVGEYIEVVDFDPASDAFYPPVDLNDPHLLAQDGLLPEVGNPQFHQQMVYAVAMQTIDRFERALGRVALWAPHLILDDNQRVTGSEYVPRLRIYPHALREANAYYSPKKKALLFGYFPARASGPGQQAGDIVFTCLSHDIIAHETTHALLDGIHPRFNEATNPDVHALHEAFADLVALLQRFSHPEVLEHQIAKTRGDFARQNMLGQLAQQFGRATGSRGSLREYLGTTGSDGEWVPRKPDPTLMQHTMESHDRGAILVAAVFTAFLEIYKSRSRDLFRIASNGTGILPDSDLHPDLVKRLAEEAGQAADNVLTMCIRALDYCPPVDVTFGDYLRAIITADADLYPDDKYNYRIAMIEAFRAWGIYPDGIRSLSEDAVRYTRFDVAIGDYLSKPNRDLIQQIQDQDVKQLFGALRSGRQKPPTKSKRKRSKMQYDETGMPMETDIDSFDINWDLETDRASVYEQSEKNRAFFHYWLHQSISPEHLRHIGIVLNAKKLPPSVYTSGTPKLPSIEVHSLRTARRRGPRGSFKTDLVVELTQRRRGYLDRNKQSEIDSKKKSVRSENVDFRFRRGCTLIVDPVSQRIRYVIKTKGDLLDDSELDRVRKYLNGESSGIENAFDAQPSAATSEESFAALHRNRTIPLDFS